MKQTAVEFLELMFLRILSFDSEEHRKKYKDAMRQAKEMEKQQIIDAFYGEAKSTSMLDGEYYYNETFKNK